MEGFCVSVTGRRSISLEGLFMVLKVAMWGGGNRERGGGRGGVYVEWGHYIEKTGAVSRKIKMSVFVLWV
jgi:hypothetical protein